MLNNILSSEMEEEVERKKKREEFLVNHTQIDEDEARRAFGDCSVKFVYVRLLHDWPPMKGHNLL